MGAPLGVFTLVVPFVVFVAAPCISVASSTNGNPKAVITELGTPNPSMYKSFHPNRQSPDCTVSLKISLGISSAVDIVLFAFVLVWTKS